MTAQYSLDNVHLNMYVCTYLYIYLWIQPKHSLETNMIDVISLSLITISVPCIPFMFQVPQSSVCCCLGCILLPGPRFPVELECLTWHFFHFQHDLEQESAKTVMCSDSSKQQKGDEVKHKKMLYKIASKSNNNATVKATNSKHGIELICKQTILEGCL